MKRSEVQERSATLCGLGDWGMDRFHAKTDGVVLVGHAEVPL